MAVNNIIGIKPGRQYLSGIRGNLIFGSSSFRYWTPQITTTSISAILNTTASSGGNVTSSGGLTVIARGVCWNTSPTPTITDSKTSDGTGTGPFVSSLTGLIAGTTYYVRAYATNSVGTAYGADIQFTTTNYVLLDTFTDADNKTLATHVMDIGNGWSEANSGIAIILGNKMVQSLSDSTYHKVISDIGKVDFDMSFDVTIPITNYYIIASLFRYSGVNYHWFVQLENDGNANPVLTLQYNAFGNVVIGTVNPLTVVGGNTYTFRILTNGNSIKVYCNGVSQFDINNSFLNTYTKIGIMTNVGGNYVNVPVDNYSAI